MDKYVSFEPNSFLHQSGKIYLQGCCDGWSTFIFGTQQCNVLAGQHFWLIQPKISHNKSC